MLDRRNSNENKLPSTLRTERTSRGFFGNYASRETWPGERYTLLRWHRALDDWTEKHTDISVFASDQLGDMRNLTELKLSQASIKPENILSYYHLKTAAKTIEERIAVPHAFRQQSSSESDRLHETRNLTEAHCGILSELVDGSRVVKDQLYDMRKLAQKSEPLIMAEKYYTGLISEQVFFATIAALRDPNIIAMPASANDDMENEVDGYVYVRDDRELTCYEIPVQIKTSRANYHRIKSPDVLPVYMNDFDRSGLIGRLSSDDPSQNDFIRAQGRAMVGLILNEGQHFSVANSLESDK